MPPAPDRRIWYAVYGGQRYRVETWDGVVVAADGEIVQDLLAEFACDAKATLRAMGATIEEG